MENVKEIKTEQRGNLMRLSMKIENQYILVDFEKKLLYLVVRGSNWDFNNQFTTYITEIVENGIIDKQIYTVLCWFSFTDISELNKYLLLEGK